MTRIFGLTVVILLVIVACFLALHLGDLNGDGPAGAAAVTQNTILVRIIPGLKWEVDPEPDVLIVSSSRQDVVRVVLENMTPEPVSLPYSEQAHALFDMDHGLFGHGLREGKLATTITFDAFHLKEDHHEIRPGEAFEHHIKIPYHKMNIGREYKLAIAYAGGGSLYNTHRLHVAP